MEGPVVGNLDVVLQKHHIKTQPCHGRSFIGNHCHTYLKDHDYTDICESVARMTATLTENQNIVLEAETIGYNFEKMYKKFSKVHKAVSHTEPILQEEVSNIQDYFMEYITQHPHQVFPKLYILKHHVPSWLEIYGFGM